MGSDEAIKNIKIKGLMTINPKGLSSTEKILNYLRNAHLADYLTWWLFNGMPGDWEDAVEAGSTWLMLGSIIFGIRS